MKAITRLLMVSFIITPVFAQAQTCNANVIASAPDSRYVDNGDGTVTDLTSGLMWKQCAEGQTGADCSVGDAVVYNWQEALQRAEAVDRGAGFAGHNDWRLPNIKELGSLVETKCVEPAINTTLFPNTPSAGFWSGSPYAGNTGYAFYVGFSNGRDITIGRLFTVGHVRLVRSGQ